MQPYVQGNYITGFTSQKFWNVVWLGKDPSMVGLLDPSIISQFTKKIHFVARTIEAQNGPKLYNMMSHDSFSEDLLEVLWHGEA